MQHRLLPALPGLFLFSFLLTTPALANMIVFTDRAAFDAAAGDYTLITMDSPHTGPTNPLNDPSLRIFVSYQDLITFVYDGVGGFCNGDPSILGCSFLLSGGTVLQPVTAFGFDVFHEDPPCCGVNPTHRLSSSGVEVALDGLSFLGFVSDTPFLADVWSRSPASFRIDNLAIQTVPEASAVVLLASGLVVLIAWRRRQHAH